MWGIFPPLVNDFLATKKLRVIGATRVFYLYNITLLLATSANFNRGKSNVLTSEEYSRGAELCQDLCSSSTTLIAGSNIAASINFPSSI